MSYDSRPDTEAHIARVQALCNQSATNLVHRGVIHDASKLEEPEKSGFDSVTYKLKNMEYGSEEYRAALRELKPIINLHYSKNSHHPEYHGEAGISGMSLFDVVEMLMDWKAATERMQKGGDIHKSLEINAERFKIDPQLKAILANTIKEMGW